MSGESRHKHDEELLRKSRDSYRSLFEHMLDGVAHCRMIFEDGKPVDMEYLEVNSAFAQITGLKNVVGRRANEVIPDFSQHNPESLEMFGKVATDCIPRRWEHYLADLDRWFSLSIYSPARGEVVIVTCNITERKKAEETLRRSREQLKAFIQHAPISIAMFDMNMNYLATSGRWLTEYGRGYAELVGRNHYDVYPDIPKQWKAAHQRGLKGETLKNEEDMWTHADGSIHWSRWAIQPWIDPNGSIGGIVISDEDITEYKKQEWRLKKMNFALNRVKESVFLVDESGSLIYVNDEVCRLLGYTREELLDGMRIPDIDPNWTNEKWKEHWQDIKGRGSVTFEGIQRTKDGRIFPVEVNANYFEYDGRCFTMGLVRDITERKKVDSELRIAATAFESHEGITVTDANGIILRVNPAFSKITGYPAEEVIGKNPRILGSGLQEAHFYEAMWKSINDTGVWEGEILDRRKNGEVYPAHITITAVKDNNGTVTNYIGTFSDITKSKKIEQELLQTTRQLRELVANYESSQEAERKSIAREVHDELGQILSTLRLDLSMIRTRFGKGNAEMMEQIKNATGLVDRAIHGVRDVSENLRPAVLGMGIFAAIEWLRDDFSSHSGIPCVLESPDASVGLEEGRAVVIFRIVQESLTNVMRHAHARNVKIVISLCDNSLCVEVRDDGKGFNVNDSKKRTSFGLLGMRERAIAWGGHLVITSAPGKGTVISIAIPISAEADKP